MNGANPRVLSDFEGQWRLRKTITSKIGPDAEFDGTAHWTPAENGLRYSETGKLRLGDQAQVTAMRSYHWDVDLNVSFDDGRFFHRVPPQGGETGHWCPPDQYDVTYDFRDWPRFRVIWTVKGPAKDYVMISDYTLMA